MKNRNIDIYLRTAFRELDAFSIPDVGTFRKIYRSASVSDERDTVHPPVIEIEFEELVHESLLLTRYLKDIIQLPTGESNQIVSAIQQTILSALKENQRFEIADIGSLKKRDSGEIWFTPEDQKKSLFSTDFFGLKPVVLAGTPASNVLATEAQDNLSPMTKTEHTKKKTLAGSIGWKPVLVVALFIALGAILIQNGPFITGPEKFAEEVPTEGSPASTSGVSATTADTNEIPLAEAGNSGTESIPAESVPGTIRTEDDSIEGEEDAPELIAEGTRPGIAPANNPEAEQPGTGEAGVDPTAREVEGATRGQEVPTRTTDISVLDTAKKVVKNTQKTAKVAKQQVTPETARKKATTETKIETYHLIAGSFSSSRTAATFVKEMEAAGNQAIILFPPAGSAQSYRVSIFSARNRKQVDDYNKMLKSRGKKTGWIYAKPQK